MIIKIIKLKMRRKYDETYLIRKYSKSKYEREIFLVHIIWYIWLASYYIDRDIIFNHFEKKMQRRKKFRAQLSFKNKI